MARLYQDFLGGRLDADAAFSATSISSPALAAMVEVVSPDEMMIVLDPDGITGEPSLVRVTGHSLSAVTVTIDALDREHRAGTDWVHPVLASDMAAPVVSTSLVSPANATAAAGASTTIHDFSITGAGRLGTLASVWGFTTMYGVTGSGSAAGNLYAYDVTGAVPTGESRWHTNSIERQMQVGVFGQLWVPTGVTRTFRLLFDNDAGSSQSVETRDTRANLTKVSY